MEVNGCPVGPKPGSRSSKVTHIKVHHRLDSLGKDIEAGIEQIRAWAAELEDARFDDEWVNGYGDGDSNYTTISGWRPMTEGELYLYLRAEREHKAQQERWDKNQLERLRKEHPEWLKDDL